jgi:hypothetical protein
MTRAASARSARAWSRFLRERIGFWRLRQSERGCRLQRDAARVNTIKQRIGKEAIGDK